MPEKLLAQLESDFPNFSFIEGKKFAFKPPKTIVYEPFLRSKAIQNRLSEEKPPKSPHHNEKYALLTLHELAHGLLKHKDYNQDISRLKMERDAWNHVKTILCARYNVPFDEDFAETQLDSYRNWLDQKSKCPICKLARYQDQNREYHCAFCGS